MAKRHRAEIKIKSVVITGTCGFLGGSILRALLKNAGHPRIISLDLQPPSKKSSGFRHYNVDLTESHAHEVLLEIFKKEGCQALIHSAFFTLPPHNLEESHELHSIGTMHLLYAAAKASIRKLILSSTTDVYGAFPDNPNFLTEDHPARGYKLSPFLKDRIDAERQFLDFSRKHPRCEKPQTVVTILRAATILGPHVSNFKTHFLQNPVVPMVLGYDPLFQFVHESDLVRAFLQVIFEDHPGVYNIVGNGVLPLSRAISIAGKVPLPIPETLLTSLSTTGWYLNVAPTPPDHINFLKYLCIADGQHAWENLNWRPVYTSQEALLSFTGKTLWMSLRAKRSNPKIASSTSSPRNDRV